MIRKLPALFCTLVFCTSILTSCTPSPKIADNTEITMGTESIESITQEIDNRIEWIEERLHDSSLENVGGSNGYKDFYDGDARVYRQGSLEYYEKLDGGIGYALFYDQGGNLIYAEIVQYRAPSYRIYFHNDTVIRLVEGDSIEETHDFDDLMNNAIALCLDNAYKQAIVADIPVPRVTPEVMDMVLDYLGECLDNELRAYSDWIQLHSNGEAELYLEVSSGIAEGTRDYYTGNFYSVYVGEKWYDRTANWDWFYVGENLDIILWENIVTGELLTLDEWRESPRYRSYMGIDTANDTNTYFFPVGETSVQYEGLFTPNSDSGDEVTQSIELNIVLLSELNNGKLYALYLNQLFAEADGDPSNVMPLDRLHLGLFYVTSDTIYRQRLPAFSNGGNFGELADLHVEGVIAELNNFNDSPLENWTIVSNQYGTEDILIDDEWHSFVEVDGNRRIYRFFSDYSGGTRFYERIVWQENRGIVHYRSGMGAMREHVEFWIPYSFDDLDFPKEKHTYNAEDSDKNLFLQFLHDEIPIVDYMYEGNIAYYSDIRSIGDTDFKQFYIVDMTGNGKMDFCFFDTGVREIIVYDEQREVFTVWLTMRSQQYPLGNGKTFSIDEHMELKYGYQVYDEHVGLIAEHLYMQEIGVEPTNYRHWIFSQEADNFEPVSENEWNEAIAFLFELIENKPEPLSFSELYGGYSILTYI